MGVIRHLLDRMIPDRHRKWWIECKDAFPILSEFLDKELDPGMMAKMERHVEDCPPCQNLFRSLEKTKELCQQAPKREVPKDFAEGLMETIRKQYDEAKRYLGEPDADGSGS